MLFQRAPCGKKRHIYLPFARKVDSVFSFNPIMIKLSSELSAAHCIVCQCKFITFKTGLSSSHNSYTSSSTQVYYAHGYLHKDGIFWWKSIVWKGSIVKEITVIA